MNWDTPAQSKWFAAAAALVLAAGLVAMHLDRTPALSASAGVPADSDMRDAVASPALMPGAAGWSQTAAGAAFLGRATHNPALLSRPLKPQAPRRSTWKRTAFAAQRVIMDQIRPGIPEPVLAPQPELRD